MILTDKFNYCLDCGTIITLNATRCGSCANIYKFKLYGHPTMILDGISKQQYYCINCNKPVAMQTTLYGTGHCVKCVKIISTPKMIKTRIKLGVAKGNKNPNFVHGNRITKYSYNFTKELKYKIFKRDNFTCQKCNIYPYNDLTCHHIDYNKKNSIKKNLITLCRKCNSFVNFNRDYWYAYFKYIMENYVYKIA